MSGSGEASRPNEQRPIALCLGFDSVRYPQVERLLESSGIECHEVSGGDAAVLRMASGAVDLLLVSEHIAPAEFAPIAAQARRIASSIKVLVVGETPRDGRLLEAVRAGATDWIDLCSCEEDAAARIAAAIELGREERRREERVARLKGICRKLDAARTDFSERVDSLCQDLSHAWQDVQGRLDEAAVVGEFRGLISQELDVEDLLRTAMQYLLTKTGATNAAVFLPGSKPTQFGLGAYVHYDCPRKQAEPLLSRLSSDVCPHIGPTDDIVRYADTAEFVQSIGAEGTVLDGCDLIAFSARDNGECMAVFFLFRNSSEPFADELAGLIEALKGVFASQMAKLVRVHHRSKFSWPEAAADEAEEGDDGEEFGEDWKRAA
ncbi:MAG: hypothetical protein ACKOYN_03290 [Planctomycetota bacterium]